MKPRPSPTILFSGYSHTSSDASRVLHFLHDAIPFLTLSIAPAFDWTDQNAGGLLLISQDRTTFGMEKDLEMMNWTDNDDTTG